MMRQGRSADALYLIESGRVGVYVLNAAANVSQLVSSLRTPATFGTTALVSDQPEPWTYIALEDSVVYRLGREVFEAVATHAPEFALAIAKSLAKQIQILADDAKVPWTDLSNWKFDDHLWANVPTSVAATLRICPLGLEGDVMTVAMADPRDSALLDNFKRAIPGVRFHVIAVTQEDLSDFVGQGARALARRQAGTIAPSATAPKLTYIRHDHAQMGESRAPGASVAPTPAVSLVDDIVATGLAQSASDIHIEHERDAVVVRYRIDGILRRRRERVDPSLAKSLVSRLKLLAGMDITAKRKPQDGRISVRLDTGRTVDLRVSSLPAKFGEKIALRILDSGGGHS